LDPLSGEPDSDAADKAESTSRASAVYQNQTNITIAATPSGRNPPMVGAQPEVNRGRKLGRHLLDHDFGFHLAEIGSNNSCLHTQIISQFSSLLYAVDGSLGGGRVKVGSSNVGRSRFVHCHLL
jgi:hypothetical protein